MGVGLGRRMEMEMRGGNGDERRGCDCGWGCGLWIQGSYRIWAERLRRAQSNTETRTRPAAVCALRTGPAVAPPRLC